MTFKEKYPELMKMTEELTILNTHNKNQPIYNKHWFIFAELGVSLICLERFCRILAMTKKPNTNLHSQTLYNLLQICLKEGYFTFLDEIKIKTIRDFRNSLAHGNFELAAQEIGVTLQDYFENHFASEVQSLVNLVNHLMTKVDAETGDSR